MRLGIIAMAFIDSLLSNRQLLAADVVYGLLAGGRVFGGSRSGRGRM